MRENDQKVIQRSYDGNIILTWYMIYRGRISRPRRADIDSRRFSNICQEVPYRSRGRRTFFRFSRDPRGRTLSEIVSRAMKNVSNGWEIKHPTGERIEWRDKAGARFFREDNERDISGTA